MANGLSGLTWDGGSAFLRFGSLKTPFLKFDRPKVETKVEKIRRLGAQLAELRTPGAVDIGDIAAEMALTDYVELILPRMPRHGGSLITFPVTLNRRHPAITGSYSILCDDCRIISDEESLENGEKAAVIKLGISVMNVWEKGADGVWKCKALIATLPSSQAKALMSF